MEVGVCVPAVMVSREKGSDQLAPGVRLLLKKLLGAAVGAIFISSV